VSNVAQRGVHIWDRWHCKDSPRDSGRRAADIRKGSALQAELERMQQEQQRAQRAEEVDVRAAAAVADIVDQVQAAAPQQGATRWDVQGA
jgi:hypothetical protein